MDEDRLLPLLDCIYLSLKLVEADMLMRGIETSRLRDSLAYYYSHEGPL